MGFANHQNMKRFAITPPAAIVDDASFTTAVVDTRGFRHAKIVVFVGATDVAFSACKVQESDASGSGFADITGATLTISDTGDNKFYEFDFDLEGRKRYLDLVLTIGNGTLGGFATAWAELYNPISGLDTATERGLGGQVVM